MQRIYRRKISVNPLVLCLSASYLLILAKPGQVSQLGLFITPMQGHRLCHFTNKNVFFGKSGH
jgi:hypothetical protein